MTSINKQQRTILNDPVYGFITIRQSIVFELIQHPWFQRLRRVYQLGLTNYVYPGANHTRFHHALGAYHLIQQAVDVLRSKGVDISSEEEEAVSIAILLHDIGHGPYSHTLEQCLVKGVNHEDISNRFMKHLNDQFNGRLELAIQVFKNQYTKKFLHQLVSGQLDMDRMDYLKRDSFFTGVHEGTIGHDRIIKMLEVHNDQLLLNAKAIYSVEKFLVARRLMYWQVYLHKTVISAEDMLIKILLRAKKLSQSGMQLFATPALQYFLQNELSKNDFMKNDVAFSHFSELDDYDIFAGIKVWCNHTDKVLSLLCKSLVSRQLFRIKMSNESINEERLEHLQLSAVDKYKLNGMEEAAYLVFKGSTSNRAYSPGSESISMLYKDGTIKDVADASNNLNFTSLRELVTRYYLCYPKILER